jgi:hypothetical protein
MGKGTGREELLPPRLVRLLALAWCPGVRARAMPPLATVPALALPRFPKLEGHSWGGGREGASCATLSATLEPLLTPPSVFCVLLRFPFPTLPPAASPSCELLSRGPPRPGRLRHL